MSPELIDTWLKIIVSVLSIAAVVISVAASRRKAITERLDTGSKRMDALDLAVQSKASF